MIGVERTCDNIRLYKTGVLELLTLHKKNLCISKWKTGCRLYLDLETDARIWIDKVVACVNCIVDNPLCKEN